MNRREVLAGVSTAAILAATPGQAARWARGGVNTGNLNPDPLTSQRNVMNIRTAGSLEYLLINHFKLAINGSLVPNGSSPVAPFGTLINTQGWPVDASIATHGYNGGGIYLPNTADYGANAGETYTLDPGPTGIGDCEFTFSLYSWIIDNVNSVNVTQVGGAGSGHFKTTTNGSPWKLVVTIGGLVDNTLITQNLFGINFINAPNATLQDFRFYRTGDAARLAAGKLFRVAAIQPIVDMNPAAIRFMDWIGGNDDQNCRWENRMKPDHGTYGSDYSASPAYGNANYVNSPGSFQQYTLSAAAGTAGNPKTTPVAMTHGEVVTCVITSGLARSGTATISTITIGATPTVTVPGGHPFITGDIVYPNIQTADGMQQLDRRRCQVTVLNSTQFTIDVPTTGFTAFANTTGNSKFNFFVSLNVGLRGAYPIVWSYGFVIAGGTNGIGEMPANQLLTFYFDKNITPCHDASGNILQGAWLYTPNNPGPQQGMPIEVCTQLVLEVNELSKAQGINNPVHLWLNNPFRGMLSMDQDYLLTSNFAVNQVDCALNGTTVNGISYPGLKSVNGPSLLLEHSNELWNGGGADTQGIFQSACAQAIVGKDNYNESIGYPALRSVCMVRDVKGSFPGETRIKFVLGGWATQVGYSTGLMDGSAFYLSQRQGGWGTPLAEHDAFAIAPYFDPWGNNFTGLYNDTFVDDNAKYLGTDNSGALKITVNASTTNTLVTTAVTNGPVVVGQSLFGAGLPPDTIVIGVAGVSPNYTLTLNNGSGGPAGRRGVNVPAGAVLGSLAIMTASAVSASSSMSVVSNIWLDGTMLNVRILGVPGQLVNTLFAVTSITGTFPNYTLTLDHSITFTGGSISFAGSPGGDYRGVANPTSAIQGFVNAARGTNPVDTTDEQINAYTNPAAPTAGKEYGYTQHSGFASAGKVLIHYEGNTNWTVGSLVYDAGAAFAFAVNQSAAWGLATTNYFNARSTQAPNMAMPAIYGWISIFGTWSFAIPDSYASHIEGQALKNTGFWPALGARNQALAV